MLNERTFSAAEAVKTERALSPVGLVSATVEHPELSALLYVCSVRRSSRRLMQWLTDVINLCNAMR